MYDYAKEIEKIDFKDPKTIKAIVEVNKAMELTCGYAGCCLMERLMEIPGRYGFCSNWEQMAIVDYVVQNLGYAEISSSRVAGQHRSFVKRG